jgi:hypothetical protein
MLHLPEGRKAPERAPIRDGSKGYPGPAQVYAGMCPPAYNADGTR